MSVVPETKEQSVQHCTCRMHCRTSCPYFALMDWDGHEIKAFCANYDTWLMKDSHFLQYNRVLFWRTKLCRDQHDNASLELREKRECQAVN